MLRIAAAALSGFLIASAALTQEAQECLSLEDTNKYLNDHNEVIVAQIPEPPIGIRFLVQRADGTFKEMFGTLGQVCHIQDFVGDPRLKSSRL